MQQQRGSSWRSAGVSVNSDHLCGNGSEVVRGDPFAGQRGPPTFTGSCHTYVMQGTWRRWRPGPKHRTAQGVGVFGTSQGAEGAERLSELLARCAKLRELATSHGVTLADDPDSLAVLDRHLDQWSTQLPLHPFLEPEIGCYVGTVIVGHASGARWLVWPNGHPVVHLSSGADLDVFRQVGRCLRNHRRTLTSIWVKAAR